MVTYASSYFQHKSIALSTNTLLEFSHYELANVGCHACIGDMTNTSCFLVTTPLTLDQGYSKFWNAGPFSVRH